MRVEKEAFPGRPEGGREAPLAIGGIGGPSVEPSRMFSLSPSLRARISCITSWVTDRAGRLLRKRFSTKKQKKAQNAFLVSSVAIGQTF
jgi:hypothetical protein